MDHPPHGRTGLALFDESPTLGGSQETHLRAGKRAGAGEVRLVRDGTNVVMAGRNLLATGFFSSRTGWDLLADDFYENPLAPEPVEFAVENLLPRAKVELAIGYRHHDLAAHD